MIIDEGTSGSDSDAAHGSSSDDGDDWEVVPDISKRRQRARMSYATVARTSK